MSFLHFLVFSISIFCHWQTIQTKLRRLHLSALAPPQRVVRHMLTEELLQTGEARRAERTILFGRCAQISPTSLFYILATRAGSLSFICTIAHKRNPRNNVFTLFGDIFLEHYGMMPYPRTDSRFRTSDMAGTAESLVRAFSPGTPCNVHQVINDAKVSDHHAILPTMTAAGTARSALPERACFSPLFLICLSSFLSVIFLTDKTTLKTSCCLSQLSSINLL